MQYTIWPVWADYEIVNPKLTMVIDLDLNNQKPPLCFRATTPAIEWQVCLIMAFYESVSYFLAPIVLNNLIHPVDPICAYLNGIGKEKCEENFGCWALTQFIPREVFTDTDPKALFLYSYLSSLSRKKEYSIDNTPCHIKKYLNPEVLLSAYTELTDKGILSLNENNFWIHSTAGQTPSLREDMKVAVAICDFIYSVELMTKSIQRDIELVKTTDLGYKVMSKRTSTRHLCPCPVCSCLPDDDVEIPLAMITTEPFHYNCGPWRPLIVLEP